MVVIGTSSTTTTGLEEEAPLSYRSKELLPRHDTDK